MTPAKLAIWSAAAVVVGIVVAAVGTSTLLDAIGVTVGGIGSVGLISAVFWAVGLSEDRDRERHRNG